MQRVTAVILVILVGLHLWASNFAADWSGVFRATIDISLLGLALFHGLNGVRTVFLDYGAGLAGRRFVSVCLTLVGITAFLFGVYGFWPLLAGH